MDLPGGGAAATQATTDRVLCDRGGGISKTEYGACMTDEFVYEYCLEAPEHGQVCEPTTDYDDIATEKQHWDDTHIHPATIMRRKLVPVDDWDPVRPVPRCRACLGTKDNHLVWCELESDRLLLERAWREGYSCGMQDSRTPGFPETLNPYRDDPESSYGQRMYTETDD